MSFLPHDWVLFKKLSFSVLVKCGIHLNTLWTFQKCLHLDICTLRKNINNFSNSFTNARCNYRYEKFFRFFVIIFHVSAIFIQTHSIMLEHMPQLPSLSLIFWFTDPPFHGYISKKGFQEKWNKNCVKCMMKEGKNLLLPSCSLIVVYLKKKKLLFFILIQKGLPVYSLTCSYGWDIEEKSRFLFLTFPF